MKPPYAAKPSYVPTIETAPGASGTETAERSGSSYASQKRWSGRGGDEWRFRCSARPLCPRFHCAVGEKPLFQRFIGELRTQGPRGARFGRSFEVVLDRAARRPPAPACAPSPGRSQRQGAAVAPTAIAAWSVFSWPAFRPPRRPMGAAASAAEPAGKR
jgi:hypothetical protein